MLNLINYINNSTVSSGRWTTQGNDNGGNNCSGDVVALAVTTAGVGQHNENGRGEEEDAVMAADRYRQQSTKSKWQLRMQW